MYINSIKTITDKFNFNNNKDQMEDLLIKDSSKSDLHSKVRRIFLPSIYLLPAGGLVTT